MWLIAANVSELSFTYAYLLEHFVFVLHANSMLLTISHVPLIRKHVLSRMKYCLNQSLICVCLRRVCDDVVDIIFATNRSPFLFTKKEQRHNTYK